MAKDLGKIKIEITEPKKPSAGVSGGGVGSSSGENRELSRMIGDSLKSSTIKIAGLAGLDGVAKTIISALSSFSRTIEKVTKTTGLQQAKTTDRALETSQKVTERIVKKPTEAYSPIGFRQPRPALPQPTPRPSVRRVLSLAEQAGQTYQRTPDRPKGFVPRPDPLRRHQEAGLFGVKSHPAFSAHLRGESGRANVGRMGSGAAANTAAKNAMGGVGKTMTTAATGIMVALRAALLNPFTIIFAILLAGVAVAAIAIAKFVATIWKWSEDLMKTRDRLAAFSGALAASKASSNINQLFRDIRSARRLEKPLTAISSQRGRIKALWHPIADLLTVIKGIVVSAFLPIIEIFVGALGKAAAVVAAFVIAMKKPIKSLAVVFRFLADILSKLSWVMPVGKAAVGTDIIATGLEGMLEGIENSNKALQDIFNELLNGNRQDASAAINADMASTASRLTGRGTDPSTGNLSKDYRWQPKFGGGSNP